MTKPTEKALEYLESVSADFSTDDCWRNDEGERVPDSLIECGYVERHPTELGNFYSLTEKGWEVRHGA